MNEGTARRIIWLAAIQEVAEARGVLPRTLPTGGASEGEWNAAFDAAADREPRLRAWDRSAGAPAWLMSAPVALAFLAGLAAETLPTGGRVNLIAFPVLTLLIWNLIVYLWLATGALSGRTGTEGTGFRSWLADRCEAWLGGGLPLKEDIWGRVRRVFLQRWLNHSRPLLLSRVALVLHLSAAAALCGLIAGMYWRGLGFEYRAGWSSTFLDGSGLRMLLAGVLGPAAWVSGIGLPDAAALDQLAWSRNPEGENAARWIHLYAITAVLYVGLPRLVLGWMSSRRVERLRSSFPLDPAALGFTATAAAVPGHRVVPVTVLPFNLELTSRDREVLRLFAGGEVGGAVQLDVRDKIGYDDIEEQLENFQPGEGDAAVHALVFNLSTTPEAEVQGELVAGLRDRVERLVVYVDGGAFCERFRQAPDFAGRLEGRRALWSRFVESHRLKPVFLRADP